MYAPLIVLLIISKLLYSNVIYVQLAMETGLMEYRIPVATSVMVHVFNVSELLILSVYHVILVTTFNLLQQNVSTLVLLAIILEPRFVSGQFFAILPVLLA